MKMKQQNAFKLPTSEYLSLRWLTETLTTCVSSILSSINTKQKENQVKQNYWVHFYVDNSWKPIKVTKFYVGTLKTQKKLSKESKYY